jgi:hypothetical protein
LMILGPDILTIRVIETDGTTTTMVDEEAEAEEAVIGEVDTTTDIIRTSTWRIVKKSESLESGSCWSESASNRRRRWTTLWIS